MARKYIPVLVGDIPGKIYLEDLHKVHQILRKVEKKIPAFQKKKLKRKATHTT